MSMESWKTKVKMRNAQNYSYVAKILQIIVILVATALVLFKVCFLDAHVDLHFHSLEWEAEQHMREAREPLVQEWHLQNPDASEETSLEVDEKIRQGLEFPI
jgi:hypothetical protein